MKRKKLLIISVSAGAGHVRAAEAIRKTAEFSFSEFAVKHIDMMEYVSPSLKKTMVDAYGFFAKKAPKVWGYIYKRANSNKTLERVYTLARPLQTRSVKRFYKFIEEYKPDILICTHSFPAQTIRRSQLSFANIPLGVVVTDYALHEFWLVPEVDYYFVSGERVKNALIERGVSAKKIKVTGIPVDPVFFEKKDLNFLQKKYQIQPDEKVVLLLSGGQGMIRIDVMARQVMREWKEKNKLHLIAIAGSNKELLVKLQELENEKNPLVKFQAVGWTNAIDEYMLIAHVIVTKSGGLTTTECLSLGKYMIMVRPIPGQEEENAEFVESQQMGQTIQDSKELTSVLQNFLLKKTDISKVKRQSASEKILYTIKNIPT